MCKVYGYARISRKEQNIDRQLRNIKAAYPDAIMVQEAYTGTRVDGRVQFEKLLKTVKTGDTIVFDSVSRMSRNAAEGYALYEQLYTKGVELVFLKERQLPQCQVSESGEGMDGADRSIHAAEPAVYGPYAHERYAF